jgi:hypothetical protein
MELASSAGLALRARAGDEVADSNAVEGTARASMHFHGAYKHEDAIVIG